MNVEFIAELKNVNIKTEGNKSDKEWRINWRKIANLGYTMAPVVMGY
jgi:hypothetical protein